MKKNNQLVLILLFSFSLINPLLAQQSTIYDIIEFHNGNIVKGNIIEYEKNDYIIIKLLETGKEATYKMEGVRNIKQIDLTKGIAVIDPIAPKSKKKRIKPQYQFKEKGLFTSFSFGFSFGQRQRDIINFNPFPGERISSQQNAIGFNIQAIVGHQYSRRFGLGGGVSYDGYNLEDGEAILTLMAHCRGYLSSKNISPFWALNAGYGFALISESQGVKEAKGGLMYHPEIGLRLGASNKTNFTLSAGYRFQKAEYIQEFPFNGDIEYRKIDYRRFLFSVGLLF